MEEPQDPPKKAKRQLTPEQLEKLAAAREKANAVRLRLRRCGRL